MIAAEHQKPFVKKWREKDKKMLYERVKERYLQMMRMRMNIILVDPMRKIKLKHERLTKRRENMQKAEERKRVRKQLQK